MQKFPHRMTDIQCNNVTQGHSCGPKKLQAGQGPATHFTAVTANGAGLLPGVGCGCGGGGPATAAGPNKKRRLTMQKKVNE